MDEEGVANYLGLAEEVTFDGLKDAVDLLLDDQMERKGMTRCARNLVDGRGPDRIVNGLTKIVLCVGHLGDMIVQQYGDGAKWGVQLDYSFDGPKLLGTGGALLRALPKLGDAFYVLYGDANGDRAVDFNDLVPVAQHYNTAVAPGAYALGDFNGDLIVVLYLLTIPTLTYFLGGWYSTSLYSKIGAIRSLTQLFAYEVPMLMAMLAPVTNAASSEHR
jgi:hypothetical protein